MVYKVISYVSMTLDIDSIQVVNKNSYPFLEDNVQKNTAT